MFQELKADKIIETAELLERRVNERFDERGLCKVVGELVAVARASAETAEAIRRPQRALRIAVTALIALIAAFIICIGVLLGYEISMATDTASVPKLVSFMGHLEQGLACIVFVGAAALFLAEVETRIKRRRALREIHRLRALAHVVDMHQLNKDPERVFAHGPSTMSSPERDLTPFQLSRYLDYCSEMLSITSKIAALYVQQFEDAVAVTAVDQVETLCTGLSRKIWQKVTVLNDYAPGLGARPAGPA